VVGEVRYTHVVAETYVVDDAAHPARRPHVPSTTLTNSEDPEAHGTHAWVPRHTY